MGKIRKALSAAAATERANSAANRRERELQRIARARREAEIRLHNKRSGRKWWLP